MVDDDSTTVLADANVDVRRGAANHSRRAAHSRAFFRVSVSDFLSTGRSPPSPLPPIAGECVRACAVKCLTLHMLIANRCASHSALNVGSRFVFRD